MQTSLSFMPFGKQTIAADMQLFVMVTKAGISFI